MKIEKIELRVEVRLNGGEPMILNKILDGNELSKLHFDEMIRVNSDVLSRHFTDHFAKRGYEF